MSNDVPGMRPGEQEAIQAARAANQQWQSGSGETYYAGMMVNIVQAVYPVIAAAVRQATLDEAAHNHSTLVEGCYRCELNRDELDTDTEARYTESILNQRTNP